MKYFFCKLIPPRQNFVTSMTADEAKLMQVHADYWRGMMNDSLVVAFGPVVEPAAVYGIGIMTLPDDADPRALLLNDPTLRAGVGFSFEIHPMPQLVVRSGAG